MSDADAIVVILIFPETFSGMSKTLEKINKDMKCLFFVISAY